METLKVLKNRRSMRAFSDKSVSESLIGELIDCARFAPTARNLQPWEFVVITNKDVIQQLAGLTDHGKFMKDSNSIIAVFCQDTKYYLEDGSAATQNILLAAADFGLAACWVAGDKKPYCEEVKQLLKAPQDYKLVSLIPLGYPLTAVPKAPNKRPLAEMMHMEVW